MKKTIGENLRILRLRNNLSMKEAGKQLNFFQIQKIRRSRLLRICFLFDDSRGCGPDLDVTEVGRADGALKLDGVFQIEYAAALVEQVGHLRRADADHERTRAAVIE